MASVYGGGWLSVPVGADPAVSQWVAYPDIPNVVDAKFTMCPQSGVFDCPTKELYEIGRAGTPAAGFQTHGINEWVGLVGGGVNTAGQICSGCSVWPDGSTRGTLVDFDPAILHRLQFVSGDGNVPVFSAVQGTNPADPAGDDVPFYLHMQRLAHGSHAEVRRPQPDGSVPHGRCTVELRRRLHPPPCVGEPTFTG
jgi:hypothetical protein